MADTSPGHRGPSSFCTQANALLRKSLIYQKRNPWGNCRLLLIPALIFGLLYGFQKLLEQVGPNNNDNKKGCDPTDFGGPVRCAVTSPPQWPPLLLIPDPENRAVRTDSLPYTGLPDASCRKTGSCPVTVLVTGNNQSLGEVVGGKMLSSTFSLNSSNVMDGLANVVLASGKNLGQANYMDPAFVVSDSLFYIQHQCTSDSPFSIPLQQPDKKLNTEATCVEGLTLWRNSSSEVNEEIYQGYFRGNSNGKINEILAAYDFSNTNEHTFNESIWYNATYTRPDIQGQGMNLLRVPRSVNLVSNAYLQFLRGPGTKLLFEFVKEMPKLESKGEQDILATMAPIFFTWVVLQLFPVILTSLVYEKQQKLRIMMKMQGLGDGPYWMISYAYFLTISLMFMFLVMFCGSRIGLIFFTMNDYTIQSVFYFIFINLQIAFAFLAAACFTNVNTATVVSYIFVFGSGLLGSYVFQSFLEKPSFPRWGILAFELYPGFSLYGGLYEFAFYSSTGYKMGTRGMRWENLTDSRNGMRQILVLMVVEWLVVLFVGYYMDQVSASGSGKSPLFFLQNSWKKNPSSSQKPHTQRQGSQVLVNMEKADISQEREKVEQLLLEPSTTHAVICDNLRKVYPGRDGNPDKLAVRGLSLALPRAECFGMLGPNGAGKTSFISMMIGLTKPTSGTAYIQGLDLRTQMDSIHTCIGVCPQDNLLWDTLTGREHLLFYGRLKNLKGSALTRAVDESLKSLNLLNGGVADKQVRKYSGGMKRRLSAAISLIGDPKVVYMDEPSTGLDPASRKQLWNVVKSAKQDRAIILTTHSMEEAEALCDRLGIFVDGSLQCVGNSKELKARYGGFYVFTMTTPVDHEEEVPIWFGVSPLVLLRHTILPELRSLRCQNMRLELQMYSTQLRLRKPGSKFSPGVYLIPPWKTSSSRSPILLPRHPKKLLNSQIDMDHLS